MAIIEFINGKNNTKAALKRLLEYIANPMKTEEGLQGGHNCDVNHAFKQFMVTKKIYHKEGGRQYIHFTQSFAPYDPVTPEMAKEIAEKLLKAKAFEGFQVAYAVHTDKDHLHTHYVINTVNGDHGKKWAQSRDNLQEIKDFSDEICRAYGLIITEGIKGNHMNRGAYLSKDWGTSWKYELFLAVKECKWHSKSKEEFVTNMTKLGYRVEWTDNRKYITFTNKEGKKCRNRKLYPPEHFTKEALLKAFELNHQRDKEVKSKNTFELLLSSIKLLQMEDPSEGAQTYPLTTLEGDDLLEKVAENKKGKGFDWDKEESYER